MTENGTRLFATTGLKQTWQLTKRWTVDGGIDHSSTISGSNTYTFNTNVPDASGGEDFTAVSLGAAYRADQWSWTGRVETRDSDTEDKVSIFSGAYGEVNNKLGLAGSLNAFRAKNSVGETTTNGDLRLGLAYRPCASRWVVLDRLDYLFEEKSGGTFSFENWRMVNNLNLNRKLNSKIQLSLQYGAKYVNETIDGLDYSGYTDLIGIEGRYDITKKWDIALRTLLLHSRSVEQQSYGAGLSAGYNVMKNVWISIGYNLLGFRDRDFSKADFTSQGPYVKFRMKVDQESVREAVRWFAGQ